MPDAALFREREIAEEFLDLVVGMVSQRSWSACHYSNSLPDMFAAIFAPTYAQAEVGVNNVRVLWSAIAKAVRLTHSGGGSSFTNSLQQCLDDIYFKDHIFVKEIIVLLQRCNWDLANPQVRHQVWGYVGVLANTKMPNENIFNTLRDIRRASKNKRVNRHRAWRVANTSNFLDVIGPEIADDCYKFRHLSLPQGDWEIPLETSADSTKTGIFTIAGHKIDPALDAKVLLEGCRTKETQPWQPAGPSADHKSSAASALLRCTAPSNFGQRACWMV